MRKIYITRVIIRDNYIFKELYYGKCQYISEQTLGESL